MDASNAAREIHRMLVLLSECDPLNLEAGIRAHVRTCPCSTEACTRSNQSRHDRDETAK